MTEQSNPTIEYLKDIQWLGVDLNRVINETRSIDLAERFEGTGEDLLAVTAAIQIATARSEKKRQLHELESLQRLCLSQTQRKEYERLSGKGELVGDYIQWFDTITKPVLDDKHALASYKLALDLGGITQDGDWECTSQIDDHARDIPYKILDNSADYDVRLLESSDNMSSKNYASSARNYQFLPIYSHDTEGNLRRDADGSFHFDYATIRRRRGAANVYADLFNEETLPVEIIKESIGIIVMNQLDDKPKNAIRKVWVSRPHTENVMTNSRPARIAGRIFEQGINSDEGSTVDIVPTSVHYFMMKRPMQQ